MVELSNLEQLKSIFKNIDNSEKVICELVNCDLINHVNLKKMLIKKEYEARKKEYYLGGMENLNKIKDSLMIKYSVSKGHLLRIIYT